MLTKARSSSFNTLLLFAAGLLIAMVGLLPFPAFATSSDVMTASKSVGNELLNVPKLIAFISYVAGTAMTVRALFALKGFIENPDDNPINIFIGFMTVASLLIILPYSIISTQNSLNLQSASVYSSSESFLQTPSCTNDKTINSVFCNLATQFAPFARLLAVISYVMAAALVLTGLLNLKAYGDDPSQTPLRSILIKFSLASFLIALPFAMQIFVKTVTGSSISTTTSVNHKAESYNGSIRNK